ncbi:uncharacterized protein [Ptychodera flava]|uniref:uncharacterized protein isoform X3 n=1 Tax=Ptychodera flava TaxID=63121 RepID=UPI00396A4E3C
MSEERERLVGGGGGDQSPPAYAPPVYEATAPPVYQATAPPVYQATAPPVYQAPPLQVNAAASLYHHGFDEQLIKKQRGHRSDDSLRASNACLSHYKSMCRIHYYHLHLVLNQRKL